VQDLLKGWTLENRLALYRKMQRKGIDQGGIFSTAEKNVAVFNQLTEELKDRHPHRIESGEYIGVIMPMRV